jgi:hypothetical protein
LAAFHRRQSADLGIAHADLLRRIAQNPSDHPNRHDQIVAVKRVKLLGHAEHRAGSALQGVSAHGWNTGADRTQYRAFPRYSADFSRQIGRHLGYCLYQSNYSRHFVDG